jgi:hypothetical protein
MCALLNRYDIKHNDVAQRLQVSKTMAVMNFHHLSSAMSIYALINELFIEERRGDSSFY